MSSKTRKHLEANAGRYAFALTAMLVGIIWYLRYYKSNPVLFGEDAYYMLLLLAPISGSLNEVIIRISILTLSILSIALAHLFISSLSRKHLKPPQMTIYIMALVAITPAFIFGAASFSRSLLVLTLSLGVLYFGDRQLTIPSLAFAVLLGAASPLAILAVILFVAVYLKLRWSYLITLLASLLGSAAAYFWSIISVPANVGVQRFPNIVADFGSSFGSSVVIIILAVLSVLFWDRQWSVKSLVMIGALALAVFLDNSMILIFHLAMIILAARTIEEIFSVKWALPTVKTLSVTVLVLSILFSAIVFVDRASSFSPTQKEHAALAAIASFTPKSVAILSSPDQQNFIEYYASRQAVVKGEKDRDYYDSVRHAAYIKELFPLLEQRGVDVIYFSDEMGRNLPRDERLRFLLINERFKTIYEDVNVGAWLFVSPE